MDANPKPTKSGNDNAVMPGVDFTVDNHLADWILTNESGRASAVFIDQKYLDELVARGVAALRGKTYYRA